MSHPLTYQLDLILGTERPANLREEVKKYLVSHGFESFVEGDISDIEIDYDWGHDENLVTYLGALQTAPNITLYRYDEKELLLLKKGIEETFQGKVSGRLSTIKTQDWQEGWKDSFKPLRINEFFIYPPWESKSPHTEDLSIMINPGMAFGTGSHATTKLCLKSFSHWYAEHKINSPTQPFHVLDVGTGTGVLAIASKLKGASTVVGTDIDPDSILAAQENAKANDAELFVTLGSVKEVDSIKPAPKTFDIVFANILLPVISELFSQLVKKVSPQGALIVSGIIVEQENDVLALAQKHSFFLHERNEEGDWLALVLKPKN